MLVNKLQSFLESRNLTGYQLARDTGIGKSTAYRMIGDPRELPSGEVLEAICDRYQIQPGEIIEWVRNAPESPA